MLCVEVTADSKRPIQAYLELCAVQREPRILMLQVNHSSARLFDEAIQVEASYQKEGVRCSLKEATVRDALACASTSASESQKLLRVDIAEVAPPAHRMAMPPLGIVCDHEGDPILALSLVIVGGAFRDETHLSLQKALDMPELVIHTARCMCRRLSPEASHIDFMYFDKKGHRFLLNLATVADAIYHVLSHEERPCRLQIEASVQSSLSIPGACAAAPSAASYSSPMNELKSEYDMPAKESQSMDRRSSASTTGDIPNHTSKTSPPATDTGSSGATDADEDLLQSCDAGDRGSEAECTVDLGQEARSEEGHAGSTFAAATTAASLPVMLQSANVTPAAHITFEAGDSSPGIDLGRGAIGSDTGCSSGVNDDGESRMFEQRDMLVLQVRAEEHEEDESDKSMECVIDLISARQIPLTLYDKAIGLAQKLFKASSSIMLKYRDQAHDICDLTELTAKDALACACCFAKSRPAGQRQHVLRIMASIVCPAAAASGTGGLVALLPPARASLMPPILPVLKRIVRTHRAFSAASSCAKSTGGPPGAEGAMVAQSNEHRHRELNCFEPQTNAELAEAYGLLEEKDLLLRTSMLEISEAQSRVAQAEETLRCERLEVSRLQSCLQESESRALQDVSSIRAEHELKLNAIQEDHHSECQALKEARQALEDLPIAHRELEHAKLDETEKALRVELAAQLERVSLLSKQQDAAQVELTELRRTFDEELLAKTKENAELKKLSEHAAAEAAPSEGTPFSVVVIDSELVYAGPEIEVFLGARGLVPDDDPTVARAKMLGADSVFRIGKITIQSARARGGVGASESVPVEFRVVLKNTGVGPWPASAMLVHAEGLELDTRPTNLSCKDAETTMVELGVAIPQHGEIGSSTSLWMIVDVAAAVVAPFAAPAIAIDIEWVDRC